MFPFPGPAILAALMSTASPDTVLELPDALVTATRSRRRSTEVSRALNLVDSGKLADRLPRNAAEALREEMGIMVQKTEHGGGNAIIRGLGSNQVLLLVDGVRLNNSTYRFGNHPYLTLVDNHMLRRLEVVRGPGSVLFGSDAMGGTVNLVTRDPAPGVVGFEAGGRASARYATADGEKILRAEGDLRAPGLGLSAGATLRETGDLSRGAGGGHAWLERSPVTQPHSGYAGRDYDAKLAWRPAAGHALALAWQSTRRPEVPRYDRYENEGFHKWLYTPQERDLVYLTYQGGPVAMPVRGFLSRHRQEEGREFRRTRTGSETREWGEVVTWGAGIQADHARGNHAFIAGVDAYLDRVDSHRKAVDPGTGLATPQIIALYPDGSYYGSYGLFLQDEVKLGGGFTATLGARYSLYRMDFSVPYDPALAFDWSRVEEDFQALTGSAGASWKVAEGVWLVWNVSQGFRAPNLSDVAKTGESKGSTYEIMNPSLGPERLLGFDAGVKLDLGRVKGSAFVHHAEISDLMASAPARYGGSSTYTVNGFTYDLQSKRNVGEAMVSGAEAEAKVRAWAALWLRANLAYVFGHNSTANDPVGGIPPLMGLFGLKWSAEAFALEAFTRFAGDQDRLSADDRIDPRIQPGGTPGWATANLRGDARFWNGMRLALGLENALDRNYREHGSGINAPGRNFTANVQWGF